jgi:hypothetical protein
VEHLTSEEVQLKHSTANILRSNGNSNSEMDFLLEDDLDDVDEFKETVVLEQMLRAADVDAFIHT